MKLGSRLVGWVVEGKVIGNLRYNNFVVEGVSTIIIA